jgi:tetratricopeptide (TPR) repeat protein
MKNNLIYVIITLFLISIIYSSYKIFQSSSIQAYMMGDFNNDTYNVPYEIYAEKLDDNYPVLTLTAMPLKFLKARYLFKIDSIQSAKELLWKAKKENPYLKASEAALSEIYFNEEKYDSSLYYSKDAFYSLTNVNRHRHEYFKNLVYQKDSIELDNAFDLLKNYNNPNHWYEYFQSRYQIVGEGDKYLIQLFKDFRNRFPYEDKSKIDDLESYVTVGSEKYSLSFLFVETAMEEFKNKKYEESIELFESAIVINPGIYTFYENAALAYRQLGDFDKALSYYDKVIYDFKTTDGKSEYLKGLLKIELGETGEGCNYLNQAVNKNYSDANGTRSSIVFSRFCE